jgi:hypothetical protein
MSSSREITGGAQNWAASKGQRTILFFSLSPQNLEMNGNSAWEYELAL